MQFAAPYSGLARVYDDLIGDLFFPVARRNFERIWLRYGLHPQSAADVACGTGTFLRYLSGLGLCKVFGVDRSLDMLAVAMAKNRSHPVHFFRQDVKNLLLPEPVDCITCNFDSLNYLLTEQDFLQALRCFQANLSPGGVLMFDVITPQQPWSGKHTLHERRAWPGGEFRRYMRLDPSTGMQTSLVRIWIGRRIYRERHRQRTYPWHLVRKLLHMAGLRLLEGRDFDTWQPVHPHTRRIAVFAHKNSASGISG